MRMRRSLIKTYALRRRESVKDNEGNVTELFLDPVEIEATIWSAGGRVAAEMYGERLAYIKNMEYEGEEPIKEGDGVCVYVSADERPDYRVISIKPEYKPKVIELEAVR